MEVQHMHAWDLYSNKQVHQTMQMGFVFILKMLRQM